MSGQRSHKTSAAQGWVAMKELLDREMPVSDSPRRRSFWFWLASAVTPLSIIFIASGLYLNGKEVAPSLNADLPLSPISGVKSEHTIPHNENPSIEPISASHQKSSTQNPTLGTENNTESDLNFKSVGTNSSSIKGSQNITKHSGSNSGSSSTSNSIQKGKAKNSDSTVTPPKEQVKSQSSEPIALLDNNEEDVSLTYGRNNSAGSSEMNESISEFNHEGINGNSSFLINLHQIDPLALNEISYLQGFEELEISPIPLIESTKVNEVAKKRFFASPFLFGSGAFGTGQGLGYQAGLGVTLSITPWLRGIVHTGYQSFNPQTTVFRDEKDFVGIPNAIVEETYYDGQIGNIINGKNLNSSTPVDNLFPYLNRVEQWQTRAGLQADLGKLFSLEGGYGYGFNTKIRTDIPILEDFAAIPVVSEQYYDLNSYSVVRENMHSVYLGMGFRPLRFLELYGRLDYVFGAYLNLDSGTNVSDRKDNLSGVQLGIRIFPLAK